MASRHANIITRLLIYSVLVTVLAVGGCRLTFSRQTWNERKWGPLVPHTSFPGDCSICHVPERWDTLRDDFTFDHAQETGYPLEGAHTEAACLRCHNDRGPVQAYVARGCAGCHQDPHAFSLGMECTKCHDQYSWRPTGLIGEHARTRFPLIGVHAIADCESCHEGAAAGRFQGAPLQCVICHQDDLARAVTPDHAANGWISDCQRCHQADRWDDAVVQHSFFPLTGGHALDCSECHTTPGIFTGLSRDCFSCHEADYLAAPNHTASGYSTDCAQCHSIFGWIPASIDHTFFPLQGNHNVSCSICHDSGSLTTFTCFNCHEHNQSDTDNDHDEVSGYTYNSAACYNCHPSGRE